MIDANPWPVDAGPFAPWRLRDEGPMPLGWYFKDPRETQQVGPFATRAEAKKERTARRRAWGLYSTDADGNRVVHIEGDAVILDRIDARDWVAGAVEDRHRFAVIVVPGTEPQLRETLADALELLAPPGPWDWVWGLEPGDRVKYGDDLAVVTGYAEESKHGNEFAPCIAVRCDGETSSDWVDADELSPVPAEGA